MDFVVSKVVMSICALMVVGALSGCLAPFADTGAELEDIVGTFCGLVDRAVMSGSAASLAWEVPFLADDQRMTFTVHRGVVTAECCSERATGQPLTGVHTWRNTGASMNISGLSLLDAASDPLTAGSGAALLLVTDLVLLDGLPTYLAFVRSGP